MYSILLVFALCGNHRNQFSLALASCYRYNFPLINAGVVGLSFFLPIYINVVVVQSLLLMTHLYGPHLSAVQHVNFTIVYKHCYRLNLMSCFTVLVVLRQVMPDRLYQVS